MSEIIDLRAKMNEKEDKEKLNPTALTLTAKPVLPKPDRRKQTPEQIERFHARLLELVMAGKDHFEICEIMKRENIRLPSGIVADFNQIRGHIRNLARKGVITLPKSRDKAQQNAIAKTLAALPPVVENGRLWHTILHSNEIDNDTRTEMLRLLATRRR